MDLRERVAAAIDAGEGSQRQVAKRFRVSVETSRRSRQHPKSCERLGLAARDRERPFAEALTLSR